MQYWINFVRKKSKSRHRKRQRQGQKQRHREMQGRKRTWDTLLNWCCHKKTTMSQWKEMRKKKNGENRKVTNFEMDLAVSFALHRTQAKRYEGRSRCRSYHLRPGDALLYWKHPTWPSPTCNLSSYPESDLSEPVPPLPKEGIADRSAQQWNPAKPDILEIMTKESMLQFSDSWYRSTLSAMCISHNH